MGAPSTAGLSSSAHTKDVSLICLPQMRQTPGADEPKGLQLMRSGDLKRVVLFSQSDSYNAADLYRLKQSRTSLLVLGRLMKPTGTKRGPDGLALPNPFG